MLTINLIREKKDFIIERLKVKNFDPEEILEKSCLSIRYAVKSRQKPTLYRLK